MTDVLKIRTSILLILIVIIPLVMQWFIINPLKERRSRQSDRIRVLRQNIDRGFADMRSMIGQYNYERVSPDLQLLDGAIPDKRAPLALITQLENLGESLNIQPSLSFEKEVNPDLPELQTTPLMIRAQGTYGHLMEYLRAIEQQPFYLTIDAVTLQPVLPNSEGDENTIIQLIANANVSWK